MRSACLPALDSTVIRAYKSPHLFKEMQSKHAESYYPIVVRSPHEHSVWL